MNYEDIIDTWEAIHTQYPELKFSLAVESKGKVILFQDLRYLAQLPNVYILGAVGFTKDGKGQVTATILTFQLAGVTDGMHTNNMKKIAECLGVAPSASFSSIEVKERRETSCP